MARPSAIYRSSQQASISKNKYKFPILDSKELVTLYDTMGFDIDESVLLRPSTSFMKSLIEQIMDKFLYISPHSLKDKVSQMEIGRDDSESDNHGNGKDMDVSEDFYLASEPPGNNMNSNTNSGIRSSINIVACQRVMYNFLCDCGVDDFSIRDVLKPESIRLRIILSALINYARFREERMEDLDEIMDQNDQILENYKDLIKRNHDLEDQIDKININLKNQPYTLEELYNSNDELENQLRNLRMIQKQLTEDHEKYKAEKLGLINELENQSALYIETEKDLEQIRPYIKESPESVKELIEKMRESEVKESAALEKLEQKLRNINVSLDSFQFLTQELTNLIKVLEELKVDSLKNKAYDDKLKSLKNQVIETEEQAKEYNRNITQIERQLKHNEERISKLQVFYAEKMKSLEERNTAQINEFTKMKSENNVVDLGLSEKESQINDWTSKLLEFRKQYDFECKEANFELEKLNSKISLYIAELKNKINESKDMVSA